jgi:hypothetical protein
LVGKRLDQQERRADDLERLLRDNGPCDAHHLAALLLGERWITQAILVVSEGVGHLDLLIERGTVIEHAGMALCQFEALRRGLENPPNAHVERASEPLELEYVRS